MKKTNIAVIGIGATGSVLAAALLSKYPETILVGRKPELEQALRQKGLAISGVIEYRVPVKNYLAHIDELPTEDPLVLFVCSKTFHLDHILKQLQGIVTQDTKIISTHNGLGTEDLIAAEFGAHTALRMSLNYGASLIQPGQVATTFFNRPNHLGCLAVENRELGVKICNILSDCGLDTQFVEDIKLFVWKKMVMKCTMASICAVTNRTIKECLDFAPTREIADTCFREALCVAKAVGYDLGEDYLAQAVGYLKKMGMHKDSMCYDITNKTPTEIDFLGGKVVEYGRKNGVATPFYVAMTNLVKALEDRYLAERR